MTTYTLIPGNEAAGTAISASVFMTLAAASRGFHPSVMPAFIPRDQVYYWSYAWQESERKAMEDLRAGRSRTFDDPMAAARYLLGSDR